MKVIVVQTLCDPMGSWVHGISQAVARLPFPFPGDLHYPRIEPRSPALASKFFTDELAGRP